jgi:hypothetical protein
MLGIILTAGNVRLLQVFENMIPCQVLVFKAVYDFKERSGR